MADPGKSLWLRRMRSTHVLCRGGVAAAWVAQELYETIGGVGAKGFLSREEIGQIAGRDVDLLRDFEQMHLLSWMARRSSPLKVFSFRASIII